MFLSQIIYRILFFVLFDNLAFLNLHHAPTAPASIPSPLSDFDTKPPFHLTNCSNHSNNINFGQTNFPNLTTHIFQSLQRQNISKQEIQNEVFFIFKPFIFFGWKQHPVFLRSQTKRGQISNINTPFWLTQNHFDRYIIKRVPTLLKIEY